MDQIDDILFGGEPMASPAMDRLKEAVLLADEVGTYIIIQEKSLKEASEKYRKLTTQTIPALMAELGELSEVKSSWGSVKLNPFWSGKITEKTEKAAFAWLNENDHGGIVKREINVSIMKGDDDHAKEVRGELDKIGADYEEKEGVHHMTLQAFIRRQAEAGTPVPTDLFNVYSGTVAKVLVNKE